VRNIGVLLAVAAIAASGLAGCSKHDGKPELTTVIRKPDGSCIGHDPCPPRDEQHITADLEPSQVTTSVAVPTVSMSPTVTEVPTVTPSPTTTMVPTVSPTP